MQSEPPNRVSIDPYILVLFLDMVFGDKQAGQEEKGEEDSSDKDIEGSSSN